MKQTLEEAAIDFADYELRNLDKVSFVVNAKADYDNGLTRGFKAGADWQARQYPWISVKERVPEEGQKVLGLTMCCGTSCIHQETFFRAKYLNVSGKWTFENRRVLAWFPIPSFDEILEANKDVLQRMK